MKKIIIRIAEETTNKKDQSHSTTDSRCELLNNYIKEYINQRMNYILKNKLNQYIDKILDEYFDSFFTDYNKNYKNQSSSIDDDFVTKFTTIDTSSYDKKYSSNDITNKYKSFPNDFEKILKGIDINMEKMRYGNEKKRLEPVEGECSCSLCNPDGYYGFFFDEKEEDKEPYEDILYNGALYAIIYTDPTNESNLPSSTIVKYINNQFYYAKSTEDIDSRYWKEFKYIDNAKMIIPIPIEVLE